MRVLAVKDVDGNKVQVFGEGKYLGREIPPKDLNITRNGKVVDFEVPKIELGEGKIIYGCECWWGDPAKFEGFEREVVSVDDERTKRLEIGVEYEKKKSAGDNGRDRADVGRRAKRSGSKRTGR